MFCCSAGLPGRGSRADTCLEYRGRRPGSAWLLTAVWFEGLQGSPEFLTDQSASVGSYHFISLRQVLDAGFSSHVDGARGAGRSPRSTYCRSEALRPAGRIGQLLGAQLCGRRWAGRPSSHTAPPLRHRGDPWAGTVAGCPGAWGRPTQGTACGPQGRVRVTEGLRDDLGRWPVDRRKEVLAYFGV